MLILSIVSFIQFIFFLSVCTAQLCPDVQSPITANWSFGRTKSTSTIIIVRHESVVDECQCPNSRSARTSWVSILPRENQQLSYDNVMHLSRSCPVTIRPHRPMSSSKSSLYFSHSRLPRRQSLFSSIRRTNINLQHVNLLRQHSKSWSVLQSAEDFVTIKAGF